jgi:Uma2 family endonuclease
MAVRVAPVKLTYHDYLTWPDDGQRYELYEGELHVIPTPSVMHQRVLGKLMFLLAQFVDQSQVGEVLHAPLDVVFAEDTVVQPDILFISRERRHIIGEQNILGAPDLVVEILSPGTEERAVEVLALSPEGYRVVGRYSGDEAVSSQVLAGLRFPAKEIFG